MSNIAIIIPARLGSTRMPRKMLRADTGRPLITYAVEAAERAMAASKGAVVAALVATDDESIREAVDSFAQANGYACRAVMTSPAHKSGTDRIAEAARSLPATVDTIVNIQGDEPDLPAEDILLVGQLLSSCASAAMSTLARPISEEKVFLDPNAVKVVMGDAPSDTAKDAAGQRAKRCLYFSRSPIPCDRDKKKAEIEPYGYLHLGIYGYRRNVLDGYSTLPASPLEQTEKLEQLRALSSGMTIVAAVTNYTGIGIDTEADYQTFVASRKK